MSHCTKGRDTIDSEATEVPKCEDAPESTPMDSGALSFVIMDDEVWKNGHRVRPWLETEDW